MNSNKCSNVYHGWAFGFMCRRAIGHTGRHAWWIVGKAREIMYWPAS